MSTNTEQTTIKIEKGVPMPANGLRCELSKTLRKLKVGDSFKCSLKQRCTIHSYAKNVGIEITTRIVSGTECRVWRTK